MCNFKRYFFCFQGSFLYEENYKLLADRFRYVVIIFEFVSDFQEVAGSFWWHVLPSPPDDTEQLAIATGTNLPYHLPHTLLP